MITGDTRAVSRRDVVFGESRFMTEPCLSCEGRGWKYVSFRRALIAGPGGPVASMPRVRDACSACQGIGAFAAEQERS